MGNLITSADAAFQLAVSGLYTTPQQIQGFAVDDMFRTPAVTRIETEMGADGVFVFGWMPVPRDMTIALLPSSLSNGLFETWAAAEDQARTAFTATGSITLNSTQTTYALINGALVSISPVPDARRVLGPRSWGIRWGQIIPAPA